jgi:aminoglycoside phosphotransferase (APT) family kinase protein
MCERRRNVVARGSSSLYLVDDGPGFCLHGTLRSYSPRAALLLERIEARGAEQDATSGRDLVHYDFHLGNVLVDPDNTNHVTAIVDWNGVRAGDVALDLVLLRFDLERRAPELAPLVGVHDVSLCAHAALRLVDWAIRHAPDQVDLWLTVGERYLTDAPAGS